MFYVQLAEWHSLPELTTQISTVKHTQIVNIDISQTSKGHNNWKTVKKITRYSSPDNNKHSKRLKREKKK